MKVLLCSPALGQEQDRELECRIAALMVAHYPETFRVGDYCHLPLRKGQVLDVPDERQFDRRR